MENDSWQTALCCSCTAERRARLQFAPVCLCTPKVLQALDNNCLLSFLLNLGLGGMRPNFFVPVVQPGQHNPRPGGKRSGTGPVKQAQQPIPLMRPQQMPPRGHIYRYAPGRGCFH